MLPHNFRFRTNWRGKIILQIERHPVVSGGRIRWRDATDEDIQIYNRAKALSGSPLAQALASTTSQAPPPDQTTAAGVAALLAPLIGPAAIPALTEAEISQFAERLNQQTFEAARAFWAEKSTQIAPRAAVPYTDYDRRVTELLTYNNAMRDRAMAAEKKLAALEVGHAD